MDTTITKQPTLESVVACPHLPSLPGIAVELLRMTRSGDAPISEIADLIANDPALTSKVLRTVNSSYYGLSSPCSTISRALGYLGLNTIKSLVLGFSLVTSFDERDDNDAFDYEAFWRRIIHAATAARLIAQRLGQVDPEEAFVAALLQDVGMLAMAVALGEPYAGLVRQAGSDAPQLVQLERDQLGFDHTQAGAALGRNWTLPDDLQVVIAHHHDAAPEQTVDATAVHLIRMVQLANLAAHVLTESRDAPIVPFIEQAQTWFGFCPNQTESLFEEIASTAREMSKLFQIAPGRRPDVSQILSEAQDELLRHQISLEQEAAQLRGDRDAMASKAYIDQLTGLANRRRFDELIEACFTEARQGGQPLAAAFIDVDEFKPLNDTHGHQVGDVILADLARRLSDVVGEAGYVCRYGGEEFVCILPNHNRCAAARLAEAMRKGVEMSPFDVSSVQSDPAELRVRASIGVAAFCEADFERYPRAAALVQLADKALYAAKGSGRNCVRVANLGTGRRAPGAPPSAPPNAPTPALGADASTPPANGTAAPTPLPSGIADAPEDPNRAAAQSAPNGSVSAPTPPRKSLPASQIPRLRALLIEDDNLHARLVSTLLHTAPNVEVHHVATAQAALQVLSRSSSSDGRSRPDLILCDLRLPDTPGNELIAAIRAMPHHAVTPIVVLSASESRDDVSRCLRAGANAYVPKRRLANDPRACIQQIAAFWRMTERAA